MSVSNMQPLATALEPSHADCARNFCAPGTRGIPIERGSEGHRQEGLPDFLSDRDVDDFPAKTVQLDDEGARGFGISIRRHGELTAAVFLKICAALKFPGKEALLPAGLEVLPALHDIGKLTPEFISRLAASCADAPDTERWLRYCISRDCAGKETYHSEVSWYTLERLGAPDMCCDVVGAHHGRPVTGWLGYIGADPLCGGEKWEAARERLALRLLDCLGLDGFPEPSQDPAISYVQQACWEGLLILADWIASQQSAPLSRALTDLVAESLVREAGLGLPVMKKDGNFKEFFGFPPRAEQAAFVDFYAGPGLYILEAPTGSGKTEAALGLAFKAMQCGDASGIYFALPTQLTSNRMIRRMQAYVSRALRNPERDDHVRLVHSKARLMRTRMGGEAEAGNPWASSNRRALLSPFGVGTVDQALLSCAPVRHAAVRTAGLLGKVVIIDEVHSYGAYTGALVEILIERLLAAGGTVVLLSATLSADRRGKFLGNSDVEWPQDPVIISLRRGGELQSIGLSSPAAAEKKVRVILLDDETAEEKAFGEVLKRVESGASVLWIENTVEQAQKVAHLFEKEGVTSAVLHSRFRPLDRQRIEDFWVEKFERNGSVNDLSGGCVLVGTQVLEQSLDIDADLLVTRIAPMDRLIQRIGRLWRHEKKRPDECDMAEVMIIAVPEDDKKTASERIFGKTGIVYPPYLLMRTLEELVNVLSAKNIISLPSDARELIENSFSEREESNLLIAELKDEFIKKETTMKETALGWTGLNQSLNEVNALAGTRYSEYEMHQVLIVDEGDLNNIPNSFEKFDLWAEERIVNVPRPVRSGLMSNFEGFQKEFRIMKRFQNIPLVLTADGLLKDVKGNELMTELYSYNYGYEYIN
ncbi:CRISPR-associated helicase Cas3' [Sutterella sp.]|uniref:CRISPR-associated helicase Cas3' n=1 Tax=Sutterella sp. TaxID=1981025 RepID=UPI0026DFCC5D|nr:CRISPR-associated helicase Cas3' [Sutterella sp.]MDO5531465.1 CRISPR-associated helicase Cas3' [Sutterella sp.]